MRLSGSEEMRQDLNDLGSILGSLGVREGAGAPKDATRVAADWYSVTVENQHDVPEVVENSQTRNFVAACRK